MSYSSHKSPADVQINSHNDDLEHEEMQDEETPLIQNAEEEEVKVSKVSLGRLFKLAKLQIVKIIFGLIALIIAAASNLIVPSLMGLIIDAVVKGGGMRKLIESVIFLGVFFLVSNIFSFIRMYLFTTAGEKIVMYLRSELFAKLTAQEIGFFDVTRTGEMVNRLASDCSLIQNTVSVNVSMGLRYLLQGIGGFVILFLISWKLTLVMTGILPLIGVATWFYGKHVKKYTKQVQDILAKATTVAEESLGNMRTVRSFVAEKKESKRYEDQVLNSYIYAKKRALVDGLFSSVSMLIADIAVTGVLFYGGTLVLKGEMSAGSLTSFILYTITVGFSLGALSSLYADLMKALGASERVFELIDRIPEIKHEGGILVDQPQGRIEFKNVYFNYPSRPDVKVLSCLNLQIPPGKVIALVGPSGGGKSTISQLISGFYHPQKGQVFFDGVDLVDIDPSFLRRQIATVSQEPVLFARSILENICYGDDDNGFEIDSEKQLRAIEVAKMANAHGFITEFPEKYETMVGEHGARLSGGQKQRVAIARALFANPKVLILDEATSALDSESEHLVQKAIDTLLKQSKGARSCLVIAHRLSTVRKADAVVVIVKGEIAEQGTHDELLKKNGVYSKLVSRQLAQDDKKHDVESEE